MTVRTVLQTTQTNVTTYDTGSLAVDDLHELSLDLIVTSASGGTPDNSDSVNYGFQMGRLDAFGNFSAIDAPLWFNSYGSPIPVIGSYGPSYGMAANQWAFGSAVKMILLNDPGCTISFTLSILGKV